MSEVDKLIERLNTLDEALVLIKDQKKKIDDEIKTKEQELIEYCEQNNQDIETLTDGRYQMKPATGRKLKRN